ncbi:MAG: 4-(cytidine 5'-diphospho)-2-C-methyl-D-erythritol kinase, partial [Bacteroidetes bacterium]|nr:4-(cytidine 5'-diphospho)-2-C-methyl-D-erythritol kinase [Bacteroidota bacterium]
VKFSLSGTSPDVDPKSNTCIKAYHLIKNNFPEISNIKLHLHKAIPVGAGLGGGSSDGAFMLTALNKKFNLGLTEEQQIHYSLQLGSDSPFFIKNEPAYATGRGEILQPIKLSLAGYKIILINPGIHINTGWAFSKITPKSSLKNIKEIIQQPIESWQNELVNDFEKPIFSEYPVIEFLKNKLIESGAVYSAMSGSGSTVFGIFKRNQTVSIAVQESYFYKEILL